MPLQRAQERSLVYRAAPAKKDLAMQAIPYLFGQSVLSRIQARVRV